RHFRTIAAIEQNRFALPRSKNYRPAATARQQLHTLSLGICSPPGSAGVDVDAALLGDSWIVAAWVRQRDGRPIPDPRPVRSDCEKAAVTARICLRVWRGESVTASARRHLVGRARTTVSWAPRLVFAMSASMLYLRENDARRAAMSLAPAADAYRGFRRLCRRNDVTRRPLLLEEYESHCREVLGRFEPPVRPGRDAVTALSRTARTLPRRRHPRPNRVIDALDAVITAGHAGPDVEIDRKLVRDLARMLGGRVLLHYADGRYLTLRPQTEHTLSTWSVHRLTRADRIRALRVRPRPEFWRPEQARPRALLSLPLGSSVACISRGRRFTAKEVKAVRTVLRFLGARRLGSRVPPAFRRDGDLVRVSRPLAGEGLIGRSGPWKRVLRDVGRVARSDCSLVLLGETGTGKERLARAVHAASRRSQEPFVPINCGAIAPDLLASELFGHIRGAFTGADRNRDGLIVQAHRGSLFLDEVVEMPPAMQVALLRVLEEKRVVPVGSTRARRVDVRIISATHGDLSREVAAGRFREDLYHRIAVFTLRLPPLRERAGDLEVLARHLLSRTPEQRTLHRDAVAALARHHWPGNIRELDNVLRAAALLADGPEVTPELIDQILRGRRRAVTPARVPTLGPRSAALLTALGDRWLAAADLARSLGVSTRTVNREIARLMEQGMLRAHGEARARRYHRTHRGPTSS
ncbi:MAG: sigma 54-interacting transcriptional regulator, partial [Planctomycetota bacterium]